MSSQYTGVQYMGCMGSSASCKRAIMEAIQFGREIHQALLLTHDKQHCFLLKVDCGDYCLIRAGFTSGFGGEGPSALAYVLRLLDAHEISILEFMVEKDLFERANNALLTHDDIMAIERMKHVSPVSKWFDYIYNLKDDTSSVSWEEALSAIELAEKVKTRDRNPIASITSSTDYSALWQEFPSVIPYSLIDNRIADLALHFTDSPDQCLLKGYRRLEGILRHRTGLNDKIGSELFDKCFINDPSLLHWEGISKGECKSRGNLFKAVFTSFRNPRAHFEEPSAYDDAVSELLVLNQLYRLEREAVEVQEEIE